MKKVTRLAKQDLCEHQLRSKSDLTDRIREDAVNDLQSLTEDFQHMMLVVASIERNYQALLSQNELLKNTLLGVVEECYCREGNRCDRCQRILKTLGGEKVEKKVNATQEYQTILKQLRKLG